MKQIKNSAALLLAVLVVFTNVQCKKEDKKSKTELLTSGQWRITAHTSNPPVDWNGDGEEESDLYDFYEACEKDNFIVFNTNGTYQSDEGATRCDPDDEQTYSGDWAFTDNESKIISDGETLNVEELTSSRLRVTVDFFGTTQTITFSH